MAGHADIFIEVYDSAIHAMSDPGGIVFKWAYQRRSKVERLAKVNAPVRSGHLRNSISASYEHVPGGVVMDVSAKAPYAVYVHEGTAPHVIGPSSAPRLVFFWVKKGRTFVGRVGQTVNHPGTKPDPFLELALEEVMHEL